MSDHTITALLCDFFDPEEVKWKPITVSGNRALALAYISARAVMDRLDDVLGIDGWQDEYEFLPDGSVLCKLRLRFGEEWITKMDVGGPSEQPDGGDRLKAAVSDSLKRVAVKFGIGRYLYRLPSQWVDYDPAKKRFVHPPQLPEWARPKAATPEPLPRKPEPAKPAKPTNEAPPKNGAELLSRLTGFESRLVGKSLCAHGELMAYLRQLGLSRSWSDDIGTWDGREQIDLASAEARAFADCKARKVILPAQEEQLIAEIGKRQVNEDDVLDYYHVKSLADLPACHFLDLQSRLQKAKTKEGAVA